MRFSRQSTFPVRASSWRPSRADRLYSQAAGLVAVMYDHLITFDSEIEFIWTGSCPSLTKFVYFLNRYVMEAMLLYVAYSKYIPLKFRGLCWT